MNHDVFISYRREGGVDLAARIKDALHTRGYSVFMDIEDLRSGKFNVALLKEIEEATDVLVILTPGCLDRCRNEGDWLLREVEHAIKTNRNIVPIFSRSFVKPDSAELPDAIRELLLYHGITAQPEMFEESIGRVIKLMMSPPEKAENQDRNIGAGQVLAVGRRGGSGALRVAATLVLLLALAIGGYAWRQNTDARARQAAVEAEQAHREAEQIALAPAEQSRPDAGQASLAPAEQSRPDAGQASLAPAEQSRPDAGQASLAPAEQSRPDAGQAALAPTEQSRQLRVPEGFRLAPGAGPETYTNTGWAAAIIHEKSGIELVYIPGGSFLMGSLTIEDERGEDEFQHQVIVPQGFYMGKYEVTQTQWERVMRKTPSRFKKAGGTAPVDNVSWEDCQAFCKAAGSGLRLPLEAEWEYACRAGTTTAFHYGDSLDSSMANVNGTYPYGAGKMGEDRQTTIAVGQFKPNAWGLYDMHGNVWEWCQEKIVTYPDGPVTLAQPAEDTGDDWDRVLRGGSWESEAKLSRSASRSGSWRGSYSSFGLRVASSLPPVQ